MEVLAHIEETDHAVSIQQVRRGMWHARLHRLWIELAHAQPIDDGAALVRQEAHAAAKPCLFNEATGVYDIPIPQQDIIEFNTEMNFIKFSVSSFSTFGIGGAEPRARATRWDLYR